MGDFDDLSFDAFDEINSPRSENVGFDGIIDNAILRRGFLSGVLSFGVGRFILGTSALASSVEAGTDPFGFTQVAANTNDTVTVPEGFDWHTVVSWGDPLWQEGTELDPITRGTSDSQSLAFGDNNDGMSLFVIDGRHVMAVNNEYANRKIMYGNRASGRPETADDVAKGMAAHGVSVFEVVSVAGTWMVVKGSVVSPQRRRWS